MAKYIEMEAAIRAVKGRFSMPVDNMIADVISNVPSAGVEPVRHGKWKKTPHFQKPICSSCGEDGLLTHSGKWSFTNYCPNCGSKMDQEDLM